jgi:hypothetical protein
MLSARRGDAASPELQAWASAVAKRADPAISVTVDFEADSNTFVVRLVKEPRVLVFRLSQSQVHGDGREAECEKTLNRKIKDLWNLI